MTDLDTLVALALGWTDIITIEFAGGMQAQGVKPDTIASGYTGYKPKHVIPKYSTDIKDAWELVEKFGVMYLIGPLPDKTWLCTVDHSKPPIRGNSAPEAICKAFLEAMKGEK